MSPRDTGGSEVLAGFVEGVTLPDHHSRNGWLVNLICYMSKWPLSAAQKGTALTNAHVGIVINMRKVKNSLYRYFLFHHMVFKF